MKSKLAVLIVGLAFFIAAASASADTQGLGARDTVDIVFTVAPDATTNQLQVQLDLYVFNDSNNVVGATMGFYWDNPNLVMDSAIADDLLVNSFEVGPFLYEDDNIATTNANQRFLFGGSVLFGSGVPPDNSRRLWATYYFTLTQWDTQDQILIDTVEFGSSSVYKFVGGQGAGEYFPHWTGPIVQYDSAYVPMANIIVNPTEMFFNGVQGGAPPASQVLDVTSDGVAITVSLNEDAPWLVPAPVAGSTPLASTISINTIGLTAGTYIDTIEVSSPDAQNSPQYVVVNLDMAPPPPVIEVSPTAFFFNAIAGGSNPADKFMDITNVGGQTLNWTVSNTQPWLSLVPLSGTDAGTVTLSVDITGLAFDDYYDTITVSDPSASNDPVLVPVTLSVGSDLPIIEVDSASMTFIVDVPVNDFPDRSFNIFNGGAGTLNYWLEENSPRVLTMTPASGTAPQEVVLTFKVPGGTVGNDYYDTIWVHSNEAINSPFPVELYFHYVDNPNFLSVNFASIDLNVFECSQGYFGAIPSQQFLIQNLGGDGLMPFYLYYESDYFTVTPDSGLQQGLITVTPNDLGLPLGTYLDTIIVSAPSAANSPVILEVRYNVVTGSQTPRIFLTNNDYVVAPQENSGPQVPSAFQIWNQWGGCMEWELDEDVPFMWATDSTGNVPAATSLNFDATGYVLGSYTDTFLVVAPTADNNPKKVATTMNVWRFHGDCDWDGQITIIDLVWLVNYMFNQGPLPRPTLIVGDMNCDLVISIEDLVWLVDYMFNQGPLPCGNPY